ncbi:helix-turn-helix transcriptional regulator [Corynebacterium tuberculostearicum]|uniref:helix-turn-helix transcriptional regulator n=1 Tax=Corynebacterium tuberculostearicum TaxID=38304 RepID=UPI00293474A9|nr:helix-turn-helix transcriptional regulator [Corynebacterium tuberculostearicum]MDV2434412.1 helix-turn-helix transcriptional regulator [Corynebacterium tuberculostearicum]
MSRLKIARLQAELTQAQLAKDVGVTRQTINLLENGRYNPTLKLCLAICHRLGRSLDQLFWEEPNCHS